MAATLGTLNPLTYRGYVYDHETGLYYLQSRYYNPTIRQFISPDAFVSTGQGYLGYNMFAYCNNNPVVFKDSSGTACVIAGRGMWVGYGGVPVGAASPYIPSDAMDYNCYAYALGEKQWKHVGGCFGAVENFDVDNVAAMVLADAQKDGRTMRIIDSYDSPIESNEYRIALRTCDEDYHFMVQHNDGRWSHKPGFCSTRLIEGPNPSVISWDAPLVDDFLLQEYGIVKEVAAVVNYYDSKTVYFAVVK